MTEPGFKTVGNEKDSVKRLKRELESWREMILYVQSVLLWEEPWHPAIISGVSTVCFTLLWLLEPSLLTVVSVAGLVVTLLDYFVPLCSGLYWAEDWTGAKEKQFEDFCRAMSQTYSIINQQILAFKDLKSSSPKLYYSVTITWLAILAYIGNVVNNLVLSYIVVTILSLLPGLVHHGILRKYYQLLLHSVANLLRNLRGSDKIKAN